MGAAVGRSRNLVCHSRPRSEELEHVLQEMRLHGIGGPATGAWIPKESQLCALRCFLLGDQRYPGRLQTGLVEQSLDDTGMLPFGPHLSLVVVVAHMGQVVGPRCSNCTAEPATPETSDRAVPDRDIAGKSGAGTVAGSQVVGQECCTWKCGRTVSARIGLWPVVGVVFVQLPFRQGVKSLIAEGAMITRGPREAALAVLQVHRAGHRNGGLDGGLAS